MYSDRTRFNVFKSRLTQAQKHAGWIIRWTRARFFQVPTFFANACRALRGSGIPDRAFYSRQRGQRLSLYERTERIGVAKSGVN